MNEEILKRVDLMTQKLGLMAGQLWSVMVHQARIEALTDLFWSIILFGLSYGSYRLVLSLIADDEEYVSKRVSKNCFDGTVTHSAAYGMSFFAGFACLIFGIWGICEISAIPTELFNPDFWALTHLKQALGL